MSDAERYLRVEVLITEIGTGKASKMVAPKVRDWRVDEEFDSAKRTGIDITYAPQIHTERPEIPRIVMGFLPVRDEKTGVLYTIENIVNQETE